jgi:hypothetical protein
LPTSSWGHNRQQTGSSTTTRASGAAPHPPASLHSRKSHAVGGAFR